MQARIAEFIRQNNLFDPEDKILLAVSGGVDSMVMCELFRLSGFKFAIAHCNFGLRGAESDADEKFVRQYARNHRITCHVKQCDTLPYAASHRLSIQEAARNLRYAYFDQLICDHRYHRVATAHHADDQMETMLLNLIRGTGLAGLHGILPSRGSVIRPLLFAKKDEIRDFASENNIEFREDSSNIEDKYLRNRVRAEVVPPLQSIREDVVVAFSHTAGAVRISEEILHYFLTEVKNQICQSSGVEGSLNIPISHLNSYPHPAEVLYFILNTMGFSRSQCIDVLTSETGATFYSQTHTLIRDRENLTIISGEPGIPAGRLEIDQPGSYMYGNFKLEVFQVEAGKDSFSNDPNYALIDVTFPFTVRPWKEGDRITPLGMKGSKLLSDVFIDARVPLPDKSGIPVLEKDDKIFWVGGMIQSELYKLTPASQKVLKFILHSVVQ